MEDKNQYLMSPKVKKSTTDETKEEVKKEIINPKPITNPTELRSKLLAKEFDSMTRQIMLKKVKKVTSKKVPSKKVAEKVEKKDQPIEVSGKKCPKCGKTNLKDRVTCQFCHTKFFAKSEKKTKRGGNGKPEIDKSIIEKVKKLYPSKFKHSTSIARALKIERSIAQRAMRLIG